MFGLGQSACNAHRGPTQAILASKKDMLFCTGNGSHDTGGQSQLEMTIDILTHHAHVPLQAHQTFTGDYKITDTPTTLLPFPVGLCYIQRQYAKTSGVKVGLQHIKDGKRGEHAILQCKVTINHGLVGHPNHIEVRA